MALNCIRVLIKISCTEFLFILDLLKIKGHSVFKEKGEV